MWTYAGLRIREGKSWVDGNGTRHPSQWSTAWSVDEKSARGLVWVADAEVHDNRFYTHDGTAKALDDVNAVDDDGNAMLDDHGVQIVNKGLKSVAIAKVKAQAAGRLQKTDWYVVRNAETGAAIPTSVSDYRAAVRAASATIEAAITNAADHNAFMALYNVPVDGNGVPTGRAPIEDWPEE